VTVAGTAATAPEPRTVTVKGTGKYASWEVTARVDFPARVLFDLQSTDLGTFYAAFDRIVVAHNFPDDAGEVAASMLDVASRAGVQHMAGRVFDAIAAVPNP
jgi:hypothetical protein